MAGAVPQPRAPLAVELLDALARPNVQAVVCLWDAAPVSGQLSKAENGAYVLVGAASAGTFSADQVRWLSASNGAGFALTMRFDLD